MLQYGGTYGVPWRFSLFLSVSLIVFMYFPTWPTWFLTCFFSFILFSFLFFHVILCCCIFLIVLFLFWKIKGAPSILHWSCKVAFLWIVGEFRYLKRFQCTQRNSPSVIYVKFPCFVSNFLLLFFLNTFEKIDSKMKSLITIL